MSALRIEERPPSGLEVGAWKVDPGFGVYVHVPFCLHRCNYCDFNTYEGLAALHEPYVEALVTSIERWGVPTKPVTSIFFGGGTPTLLSPQQLGRVLDAIRRRLPVATDVEVTLEANPETVDEKRFTELLEVGFNRVSIGVQSLAAEVLERLGRTHDAERALNALVSARRVGFTSVNADLIYGSPWERPQDWARSLEGVVATAPTHVSAYALTLEESTPLHTLVASGRVPPVDPDVQAERYEAANAVLGAAGYHRYEVSNWARPGWACRHNVLYWSAGDYAAFGAGAHGHIQGRRSWHVRLPREFIAAVGAGESTEAGHERLGGAARAREALMLGLRLTSGVLVDGFRDRFEVDPTSLWGRSLDPLLERGMLSYSGGWLRVPPERALVLDDIVCRLLL